MKGKLFRPTLLLLSHRASGGGWDDARAVTLAAVVELIHLATLVHDDSVDHSVLRRGMPTVNALFSHQVAVIMGDYLYSRAIIELVGLDDLAPLRVFARVTNEMTVGEMRQLEAHDKLAYGEADYDQLIRSKTASLLSGACEVGALVAPVAYRAALTRFGCGWAWRSRSPTTCSTTPSRRRSPASRPGWTCGSTRSRCRSSRRSRRWVRRSGGASPS